MALWPSRGFWPVTGVSGSVSCSRTPSPSAKLSRERARAAMAYGHAYGPPKAMNAGEVFARALPLSPIRDANQKVLNKAWVADQSIDGHLRGLSSRARWTRLRAPSPEKPSNDRLPPVVSGAVVGICASPFLLNLLGFDFSSPRVGFDAVAAAGWSQSLLTDSMHRFLAGGFTHTILEWSAFCTAIFTVSLAFVHYSAKGDVAVPVVGLALLCAGAMDAFHTLAADHLIEAIADNRNLIPFTWAICRVSNALIMLVGVGILLLALASRANGRHASCAGDRFRLRRFGLRNHSRLRHQRAVAADHVSRLDPHAALGCRPAAAVRHRRGGGLPDLSSPPEERVFPRAGSQRPAADCYSSSHGLRVHRAVRQPLQHRSLLEDHCLSGSLYRFGAGLRPNPSRKSPRC